MNDQILHDEIIVNEPVVNEPHEVALRMSQRQNRSTIFFIYDYVVYL